MTMIPNSIFVQLSSTDVAVSSFAKTFLLCFVEYHRLWKFKLIVYLFDIFYKRIYKYLGYIIVLIFSRKRYWIFRINAVIEAFYIVTKRARYMLLIFISIGCLRIGLTCIDRPNEGLEICIDDERDTHLFEIMIKI